MRRFLLLGFACVLAFPAVGQGGPPPPDQFIAVPGFDGIYLEWTRSPVTVESYRVERAHVEDGDTLRVIIGRWPRARLSHFDTTAVGGVWYDYRIQAIDFFARIGPWSEPRRARFLDIFAPSSPDTLAAEVGERGVFLSWGRAPEEDTDVSHYRILRGAGSGGLSSRDTTRFRSYLDSLVTPGVTYSYAVQAVDFSENASEPSDTLQITVPDGEPPAAPDSLVAEGMEQGIRLTWSPSEAVDLAGFRLYRGRTQATTGLLRTLPPDSTSFLDTSAVERVFYIYRVTAYDFSGNEGEPAFAQTFRPDQTAPAAPDGLKVSATMPAVRLEWQPNHESDLAGYLLTRTDSALDDTLVYRIGASETRFIDSGAPGTASWYSIAAVDSSENLGPPSSAVLAVRRTDRFPFALRATDGHHPSLVSLPGLSTVALDGALEPESLVAFTPTAGEAFWYSGDGHSADSLSQVALDGLSHHLMVHARWNYIGNPFDITVDWLRVLDASAATGSLLAWEDGIWRPTRRLVPGAGYAWFNTDGVARLSVPYLAAPKPGVRTSSTVVVLQAGSTTAEIHLDATPWADALALLPPNPWQSEQLAVRPVGWSDWVTRIAVGAWPRFEVRLPEDAERLFVRGVPPGMVALVTPGAGLEWAVPEAGLALPSGGGLLQLRLAPDVVGVPRPILLPPYPNPAGRRLSVDFGLSVPGPISLELIDTLGRTVRTLERGTFGAGMHTVVHRPNLPGGTYLLRLRAEGVTLSRTVVIIR